MLEFAALSLVSAIAAGSAPAEAACDQILSPFNDSNRGSYQAIGARIISRFGAHRNSYLKDHKHAGLDLSGRHKESVRTICPGKVVDIHLGFPHRTIVVQHEMPDGDVLYSSYKHVEEIKVAVGDRVDTNTELARLFNAKEQKSAAFKVNHLHFEMRHSIKDGGEASWTSMSMAALRRFCLDPELFFKTKMGNATNVLKRTLE